jgi:hypothetical protein
MLDGNYVLGSVARSEQTTQIIRAQLRRLTTRKFCCFLASYLHHNTSLLLCLTVTKHTLLQPKMQNTRASKLSSSSRLQTSRCSRFPSSSSVLVHQAKVFIATEAISERAARAHRRQKRKDHPSAAPEPPVKAIEKQRQKRSVPKPRRITKPPAKGCARPGLPYGDSDSGEDCINVALPQYILDRIVADEEEERREAESIKAESKVSIGKASSPCSLRNPC